MNKRAAQILFDCGGVAALAGTTDVNDGQWHHVVGTYDGAMMYVYVDGVEDASVAATGPINTNELNVLIGDTERPGEGPRQWNGLIDDVRIYNKALTPQEIELVMRINPLLAWSPSPSNNSTPGPDDVTALSWMPGENAVEHDVYFGIDQNAVEDANTSDTTGIYQGRQLDTTFVPSDALQIGQTYYWRIDEYHADGTITQGSVWNFWVRNYLIVDDFEDYENTGDPGNRIFEFWRDKYEFTNFDGSKTPGNGTGMTVGVDEAPYGPERTIVHGGAQSLPLSYDNTEDPFYSETDRTFDTARNWKTWHETDMQTLSLWFQGRWGSPNGFVADGSTYTVTGSGVDIWNTADEFHYVYLPLNGDGSITAKVESVDNTDDFAKAGVMMRNGLEADAANLAALVAPSGRVTFQQREFAGNETTSQETGAGSIALPYWVRLTRAGSIVTGEMSVDGQTWETIAGNSSVVVSWFGDVYVGLAVTSHVDAGTACEAVLSNVVVTGAAGSVFTTSMDIGLPVNDSADLYVTIADASGQTVTVNHEDNPNAVTQSNWVQWLIPLDELDSQVDLTQVKKMIIGIGDKQSTGEGKLYIDDIHVLP